MGCSSKRVSKQFGKAAGRHSVKRIEKHSRVTSGKKLYKLQSTLVSDRKLRIVRCKITRTCRQKMYRRKRCQKLYQLYRDVNGLLRKRKVKQYLKDNGNGNRVINLDALKLYVSEISLHAALCQKAIARVSENEIPIKLMSEIDRCGLVSVLSAKCVGCNREFNLQSCPKGTANAHFDVNVRSVWGTIVTGNGHAHMEETFACLNVPYMTSSAFNKIEQDINKWWRECLEEELDTAILEEKRIALQKGNLHEGVPAISVITDGGWSKRSHKHTFNAMGGVAIIVGAETKKFLHVGVRNRFCCICARAKNIGCAPQQHICFKNWDKSSQAMEADIIVEGFLRANQFGIRYINLIGDGDSSVFARIREEVPGWGLAVKKYECANHACKCLRSNLEKLVDEKPEYKGKGNLTKATRIRIVSAVRCAIRMRSHEANVCSGRKKLAHDIRNSVFHIFGNHEKCSTDFCKAKSAKASDRVKGSEDIPNEEEDLDICGEQAEFWMDGDSIEAQEQARLGTTLKAGKEKEKMLCDIYVILNKFAEKSERYIGNFTTNVCENWMRIRSKFDGGKVINWTNRGSWNTRCYAAGLRHNIGPTWSNEVWERCTGSTAGETFTNLYEKRSCILQGNRAVKSKPSQKANRWKKKMQAAKTTKSGKLDYGKDALDVTEDISEESMKKLKEDFMKKQFNLPIKELENIEQKTKDQSISKTWKEERRKRITSSNIGKIYKRSCRIPVKPIVKQLLYSSFNGNKSTRIGHQYEKTAIDEYCEKTGNTVHRMGLVVHPQRQFLAASPDGKVTTSDGKMGLIEVKNLLYCENTDLLEAAKNKKRNFCLQIINDELTLKRNHDYFYQCQGLMSITQMDWLDFVVRTDRPYQLHIERLYRDENLWMCVVSKLTAFYYKVLLPELVCPRNDKCPGIREPGIWYENSVHCNKEQNGKSKSRTKCNGENDPGKQRSTGKYAAALSNVATNHKQSCMPDAMSKVQILKYKRKKCRSEDCNEQEFSKTGQVATCAYSNTSACSGPIPTEVELTNQQITGTSISTGIHLPSMLALADRYDVQQKKCLADTDTPTYQIGSSDRVSRPKRPMNSTKSEHFVY